MNYICKVPSPMGELTLSGDGLNLTGLWMEGQKYFGAGLGKTETTDSLPMFTFVKKWLDDYFAGKNPPVTFPLAPPGSGFRKQVWDILLTIPYGTTITYGQIAKELAAKTGKPASAQAVGGAVGHNPISIIIPCHRVVGSGRSLTGYAGGIEKKIYILKHEGLDMNSFTVPTRGTAL